MKINNLTDKKIINLVNKLASEKEVYIKPTISKMMVPIHIRGGGSPILAESQDGSIPPIS